MLRIFILQTPTRQRSPGSARKIVIDDITDLCTVQDEREERRLGPMEQRERDEASEGNGPAAL